MFLFYIFIFLFSCFLLTLSSRWIVSSLAFISKFLGWKEFVVAFFVMSFASSAPNLFVGIISAINKIPQLSFGDIMGGNLVDLTLVVAIAVLISKNGIEAGSRTVQATAIFTVVAVILPLLLVSDGLLSRADGVILIGTFLIYSFWLFAKKERFEKVYDGVSHLKISTFLKSVFLVFLGIILLFFGAEGIIKSAEFFAKTINFPIGLIGILIVGLGTALPETFFSLTSVKRGETWMILGNLMGSVVNTATLVLGIVALIYPIKIVDFSPYVIARLFIMMSVLFFFLCVHTDRKITKKEALFLLGVYIVFLICEVFFR